MGYNDDSYKRYQDQRSRDRYYDALRRGDTHGAINQISPALAHDYLKIRDEGSGNYNDYQTIYDNYWSIRAEDTEVNSKIASRSLRLCQTLQFLNLTAPGSNSFFKTQRQPFPIIALSVLEKEFWFGEHRQIPKYLTVTQTHAQEGLDRQKVNLVKAVFDEPTMAINDKIAIAVEVSSIETLSLNDWAHCRGIALFLKDYKYSFQKSLEEWCESILMYQAQRS